MSNRNITQSPATKLKIGLANKKDHSDLHDSLEDYISKLTPADFPSIVSACIYAGVSEKAVLSYELRTTDNSDIRGLLDNIRMLQKKYLLDNGLSNKINGKLTGLLLSSDHGINDRPQQLTQNNTFNISPELLAEAIELSRKKAPSK